uniref:Cadherin-related family member 1a n=1 Tax=Cyprinus carpio TaxID=7962 RepID=A0A8C1RJ87_CYPCA
MCSRVKACHWIRLLAPASTDYAPYFYDNGPNSNNGNMALLNLSEDTPKGTQIYVLNGTDPEVQPVKYGMTFEPGSKEYFRVHPKSGTVTLIEELDREAQDAIEVFVSISDGLNKVTEKVSVFVMDANDERPQFQTMPSIVDVPENTTSGSSIYKVQAVDRDTGSGGSVTYFLQSSEPSTKFAIDHHSGVLRIKPGETLDYEKSHTYFITVVAKDGGGIYKGKQQVMSSSATLTINVIDTQDTPPVFVGTPYFGYVYEVSSPGSEIFTVFAKDGDMDNPNPIIHSIESGADGVFAINKTSGCITLKVYPAELRREIFNIKVKASEVSPEGKLLDFAVTTVTIRVVDLNNHPPTFFGENGPQNVFELTMYEHPPEGEFLRGLKITVNDSDQGSNAKFHLRLVGPGHMLRVVPQTVLNEAQVTILVEDSAAMDFEKSQFLTFKLLAVEIDTPERFSATADIIIHLLDTNDNAPKFSSDFYITRIPENSPGGSSVMSVTVSTEHSRHYKHKKINMFVILSRLFSVTEKRCIINLNITFEGLDQNPKSCSYNFYVKAEDTEGKYSLAEVFVTIMDLNDHSPAFNENSLEKTMVIGAPVKIEAIDEDAEEPNNVIEYSIMKSDPDDIFNIDADTGEIKLKPYIKSMDIIQNISSNKDCTWSVVVQAKDRGSPSFSTTKVVKIDITEATQLKGPLTSFLLKSRENPMQFLGLVSGVIIIMVFVTVFISTVIYVRNVKSNKILPSRRIIQRKRKPWGQDDFHQPFREECCGVKFRNEDLEIPTADNINCNNNVKGCFHRTPPSPPDAPVMPPPLPSHFRHGDREWTVPTVSASVASKTKKRSDRCKDNPVNTALVSELKLRLEQKNMANRY